MHAAPVHKLSESTQGLLSLPPVRIAKSRHHFFTSAASSTQRESSGQAGPSLQASKDAREGKDWEIKMLYDGGCPLCMREVNMLRRRDEGVNKIEFVDIDAPEYDPAKNAGISYEQGMANIHAILPDGRVVTNVEVFRRLYEAVGLGWVYAITKNPVIGRAAEWVYGVWAKFRLPITGRPDMDVIMQEKKTCR
ncbi:g1083 [Coccomyxa viridis]|uniref:G1083 protein n=1 Tax=Coccomyxa viridis TaxID=1274662 RepID=A0ABP1FIV1_9CHLO